MISPPFGLGCFSRERIVFSWDRLGLSTHDALGQGEVAWTDKNGERYFDSRSQAGALWNEQRCLGVRRQEHPGHLYSSDK